MNKPISNAELRDKKSLSPEESASEHLLIATGDIRRREFLRKFLTEQGPRFKLRFADEPDCRARPFWTNQSPRW